MQMRGNTPYVDLAILFLRIRSLYLLYNKITRDWNSKCALYGVENIQANTKLKPQSLRKFDGIVGSSSDGIAIQLRGRHCALILRFYF